MDTDQIFKLLSIPLATEILRTIWNSHHGIRFNELTRQFKLSATDLYTVVLRLTECGLIFYAAEKYNLNPLGRGVMEAINIIEKAVEGEDIVVFDISRPRREKIIMFIDNIVRN